MSDYSKNIIYLSQQQYETLKTNGSITVDGTTVTYDENDLYVTPQSDPVLDVQVNSTSIVNNGTANIPIANNSLGVVNVNNNGTYGLKVNTTNGTIYVQGANAAEIKNPSAMSGDSRYFKPIIPGYQHIATFYGLATAAGDSTQSVSDNAVGTYTTDAKTAIRSMIDAVGKTEQATSSTYGVVKLRGAVRSGADVAGGIADAIYINSCSLSATKGGSNDTFALTPSVEHGAVFYGLSKVAGVDLANETVTLGTYPANAQAAIRSMLGVEYATDADTQTLINSWEVSA